MSTNTVPSTFEEAYWIRNKSSGSVLGIGATTGGLVPSAGQDKIGPRQTLADRSQMWLTEPLSDGVSFRIRNAQSGDVLDVRGSEVADGTPVIIYGQTNNPNQQWTIEWVDDADGSVYYRVNNNHTKKALTLTTTSGNPAVSSTWTNGQQQRWVFEPVGFPPVYWISHAQTGWYLQYDTKNDSAVANDKILSTDTSKSRLWFLESIGDAGTHVIRNLENDNKVLDLSASGTADGTPVIAYNYHGGRNQQWQITDLDPNNPDEERATSSVLLARSQSPTVVAGSNKGDEGVLWAVEPAGDAIAVVSTRTIGALDHYAGDRDGTTIEAYPNNGTDDPLHQWIPLQWYLEVLSGTESSTVYAIINKISGMVLDHWDGTRIEAQTDDTGDPHHQWRLVPCPCGENYFQVQNVSTDRYLEERVDNVPNANATTPIDHTSNNDRAQCWELVFTHVGNFDLINMDDDVLQRLLPHFQSNDSEISDIVSSSEHRAGKRKERTRMPTYPKIPACYGTSMT
ncbi:MAG: hypothetical protein Q9212_001350 [Teloschistes hypoglaucus]